MKNSEKSMLSKFPVSSCFTFLIPQGIAREAFFQFVFHKSDTVYNPKQREIRLSNERKGIQMNFKKM